MQIQRYCGVPSEALTVRITVFVEEQGFVDEIDEIDKTATHFVLFSDLGQPLATCRTFTQDGGETYILGRLAVLKAYRGKGYGSRLVQETEAYVREAGGKYLQLHSQCHAAPFYERLGYACYGDVEDEQGHPHIWMRKAMKEERTMSFLDIANARQSCRKFDATRDVESEKLECVLQAARLSPSASNGQPYHLTVCTGALAGKVAKATQAKGANKFSSDAPVQIVISEKPNIQDTIDGSKVTGTDYRSIDIGIAVAYLTAEATAQGLSTCILGWLDGDKLRELCGLDGAARLVVSLGYAKADDPLRPKKRKTAAELITRLSE